MKGEKLEMEEKVGPRSRAEKANAEHMYKDEDEQEQGVGNGGNR